MRYYVLFSVAFCLIRLASSFNCSLVGVTDVTDAGDITDLLYDYCTADTNCTDLYFGSGPANATVFAFLVRNLVSGYSHNEPLESLICDSSITSADALKNIWILLLVAHRYIEDVCGPNFRPILDANSMSIRCVCESDKACNEHTRDRLLIYLIAVLMLILSMLLVSTNIYRIALDVGLYQMKMKGKASMVNLLEFFL